MLLLTLFGVRDVAQFLRELGIADLAAVVR
jgi:hypothetical protein